MNYFQAIVIIEKLQRCLDLLEKLEKENIQVDILLNKFETNLNLFEKSENELNFVNLKRDYRELIDGIEKTKELKSLLKQNSIRLTDLNNEEFLKREKQFQKLKLNFVKLTETV